MRNSCASVVALVAIAIFDTLLDLTAKSGAQSPPMSTTTELRPREEKQREYAKQQEAERRRQAEQEREAERQRRQEEQQREAERERRRKRDQAAKRQSEKNDWWTVLEVSSDASKDEIRRGYLRKIKQYHPDRVSGLGPEFIELAWISTEQNPPNAGFA
jgi:hypothetical protein